MSSTQATWMKIELVIVFSLLVSEHVTRLTSTLVACWLAVWWCQEKGKNPTSLYRLATQTDAPCRCTHQLWQTRSPERKDAFNRTFVDFKDQRAGKCLFLVLLSWNWAETAGATFFFKPQLATIRLLLCVYSGHTQNEKPWTFTVLVLI